MRGSCKSKRMIKILNHNDEKWVPCRVAGYHGVKLTALLSLQIDR